MPDELVPPGPFDGALAIGVFNYVEDLEGALRALVSAVRPAGWVVFTVPLSTAEGRIYALTELVNRRRLSLYSPEETAEIAGSAGLRVGTVAAAGLGRGGLTLVVVAGAPGMPPEKGLPRFGGAEMKVLVTGGAGCLGLRVAGQLLAGGHEVAVVDELRT